MLSLPITMAHRTSPDHLTAAGLRFDIGTEEQTPARCSRAKCLWAVMFGRVAEWFKAAVLKTAVGESLPWVRIPPLPPAIFGAAQRPHNAAEAKF